MIPEMFHKNLSFNQFSSGLGRRSCLPLLELVIVFETSSPFSDIPGTVIYPTEFIETFSSSFAFQLKIYTFSGVASFSAETLSGSCLDVSALLTSACF